MSDLSKNTSIGYVSVVLRQVEGHTQKISRLEEAATNIRNNDLAPARLYQRAWMGLSALTLAFGFACGLAVYKQKLTPTWEQEIGERIIGEQDCREEIRKTGGIYSLETMAPCLGLHRTYFTRTVQEENKQKQMTYGIVSLAFLSCSFWAGAASYRFRKECKEAEGKIRNIEGQIESAKVDRDLWHLIMGVKPK